MRTKFDIINDRLGCWCLKDTLLATLNKNTLVGKDMHLQFVKTHLINTGYLDARFINGSNVEVLYLQNKIEKTLKSVIHIVANSLIGIHKEHHDK